MRVLFLAPNLAAGGAERQLSILAPGLRERGFDARLIALDGGGPFEAPLRASGVPLEVLGMRHQADLGPLARSPLVRQFEPQAVVSSGVSGLYVGTAIALRRHAIHAYNEHRQVGLDLSRRREAMLRLIVKRLDLVIAVSAEQRGVWLARGYPPDRIVTVANGVEANTAAGTRVATRRALGISDSAIVALLVARLRPEKRVADFARAVARSRQTHPELIGLIAGEGPDQTAVQAAVTDPDAVRLLGHRDDIPRLLAAADVFVLTSEYEALPMAILEAMAAGLPVIATRVGGIPDIVEERVTGILVAPGNIEQIAAGLTKLTDDHSLRRAMGAAGQRRHRERWSADKMIEGYARVLRERWAARGPAASSRSTSERRSVPGVTNRKL